VSLITTFITSYFWIRYILVSDCTYKHIIHKDIHRVQTTLNGHTCFLSTFLRDHVNWEKKSRVTETILGTGGSPPFRNFRICRNVVVPHFFGSFTVFYNSRKGVGVKFFLQLTLFLKHRGKKTWHFANRTEIQLYKVRLVWKKTIHIR